MPVGGDDHGNGPVGGPQEAQGEGDSERTGEQHHDMTGRDVQRGESTRPAARSNPGITNKRMRGLSLTEEQIDHMPNRPGVPDVRLIEISAASCHVHRTQSFLRLRLLRMEMNTDVPASRRAGATHRAPDTAGRACHQDRATVQLCRC